MGHLSPDWLSSRITCTHVTPAPHTADEVADSFFAGAGALTPFIHESLLNTASPVCYRQVKCKRAQRVPLLRRGARQAGRRPDRVAARSSLPRAVGAASTPGTWYRNSRTFVGLTCPVCLARWQRFLMPRAHTALASPTYICFPAQKISLFPCLPISARMDEVMTVSAGDPLYKSTCRRSAIRQICTAKWQSMSKREAGKPWPRASGKLELAVADLLGIELAVAVAN